MSLREQIYIIPLEKNKLNNLCHKDVTDVNEIKNTKCTLPPIPSPPYNVPKSNYTPFDPKKLSQGTGSFRDQFN